MQSLLGRLYDVDVRHDVYVSWSPRTQVARRHRARLRTGAPEEELLLAETDDGAAWRCTRPRFAASALDDADRWES